MKKLYRIKVNGKTYKVELEAVEEVASEEKKAEAPKAAAPKEDVPAAPASSSGKQIVSPIQGQVTKVLVNKGAVVKKGTPVFIVEAMKLENEVVSPYEGILTDVLVKVGDNVTAKQPLANIG